MSTVNEKMTSIADALREASGIEGKLTLDDMVREIGDLVGGVSKNSRVGYFKTATSAGVKTVTHGLGVIPSQVFLIYAGGTPNESMGSMVILYSVFHDSTYYSGRVNTDTYRLSVTKSTATNNYSLKDINNATFKTPSYLAKNSTYLWVVVK